MTEITAQEVVAAYGRLHEYKSNLDPVTQEVMTFWERKFREAGEKEAQIMIMKEGERNATTNS
jgi:hypothetical protein